MIKWNYNLDADNWSIPDGHLHCRKSSKYRRKRSLKRNGSQIEMVKVVKIKKELLSPCGLYCGLCRIYNAHKKNDIKFKRELLPRYKAYGAKTVDDIACTGCLSDGIIFSFCKSCRVKDCIKDKRIEGCRLCNEFPCEIIENWPSESGKKIIFRNIPAWRELGTEKWVEQLEKSYQCPECGSQLFRGIKNCYKCNFNVDFD